VGTCATATLTSRAVNSAVLPSRDDVCDRRTDEVNDQLCPNCRVKVQALKISEGVVWTCDGCGGLSANVALLRRHSDRATSERLWRIMRSSTTSSPQKCPSCAIAMIEFDVEKVQDPTTIVSLTGCSRCQVFWFDRGEWTSSAFPSADQSGKA
jgi:Zn-finger nucleic acid-binding protein